MRCSCSRIRIGRQLTEHRDWNPDCPEHGLGSDWYQSDEQIAKRRVRSERLRSLQAQARKAREDVGT